MRAKRVGRRMSRASRAVFVFLIALFAALAGAALANADVVWEFGEPNPGAKKPGVVVPEEPAGGVPVLGDAGPK